MLKFAYKNIIRRLNLKREQLLMLKSKLEPGSICFGNFVQGPKICPTTTALAIKLGREAFISDAEVKKLFRKQGISLRHFYFLYIFFDLPSIFSKRFFFWSLWHMREAIDDLILLA